MTRQRGDVPVHVAVAVKVHDHVDVNDCRGPWKIAADASWSGTAPTSERRGIVEQRTLIDERRSVYFGRNRARPSAGRGAVLPYGDDPRRRDREGIDRKTPAF
jgi:hypothetical protein